MPELSADEVLDRLRTVEIDIRVISAIEQAVHHSGGAMLSALLLAIDLHLDDLGDDDSEGLDVRLAAVEGLSTTDHPAATQALISGLQSNEDEVAGAAADALGARRHASAVLPLEQAMRSGRVRVWESAMWALCRFDRSSIDDRVRAFQERWEDTLGSPLDDPHLVRLTEPWRSTDSSPASADKPPFVIRLWVDSQQDPPDGWVSARSESDAMLALRMRSVADLWVGRGAGELVRMMRAEELWPLSTLTLGRPQGEDVIACIAAAGRMIGEPGSGFFRRRSATWPRYGTSVIDLTVPGGDQVTAVVGGSHPPVIRGRLPYAVVTAAAPFDLPMSDAESAQAHDELLREVAGLGFRATSATGRSRDGIHAQAGVAIWEIDLPAALGLGRRFGQHAIFFGDQVGLTVRDCSPLRNAELDLAEFTHEEVCAVRAAAAYSPNGPAPDADAVRGSLDRVLPEPIARWIAMVLTTQRLQVGEVADETGAAPRE